MTETKIEAYIKKMFIGNDLQNALEFVAFLRENGMIFERGTGYWADKLYWMIKYHNGYVCFILIDNEKINDWIIWSDDSGSECFTDFSINEHMKKIAWENVDFCGNCGSCEHSGGTSKIIFGKNFDKVCITTFKFINPNDENLNCLKELVQIRMKGILNE